MFFFRLLFVMLLMAVIFAPVKALAFTVSPVKFFITINPGATERLILDIKNNDKQSKPFKFSVIGLRQDENGRPVFSSGIDEAEEWARPEFKRIIVASGASEQVVFFVKVPLNAMANAHHIGLVVEEDDTREDGSVGLSPQVIAIVTLQTAGLALEKVDIEKWLESAGNFWDSERVFESRFFNAGNIDTPVSAKLYLKDFFGKEVASRDLAAGNNLLAESRRSVEARIALPKMWPGWYEARLQLTYGRTKQNITAVARILYFPKWIILFATAVLILFVFFKLRRSYENFFKT